MNKNNAAWFAVYNMRGDNLPQELRTDIEKYVENKVKKFNDVAYTTAAYHREVEDADRT